MRRLPCCPKRTPAAARNRAATSFVGLVLSLLAVPTLSSAAELDLKARTDCAWALEEARWAQRIWPAENPGPKPALSELLDRQAVAAEVEQSLRMQAALAARYGLQFEHAQLQRELQRMAEHSQAPRQLQRLFDALQGDPLRVQECLLRPQRVQAALREAYQNDAALHARPRALAEAAEAELLRDPDRNGALQGASPQHLRLLRETAGAESASPRGPLDVARLELPADAWEALRQALSDSSDAALPWATVTRSARGMRPLLREHADGFELLQLDRIETDPIDGASLQLRRWFWPKQSFEDWWSEEAAHWPVTLPTLQRDASLQLPQIAPLRARLGTQDAWLPLPAPSSAPTARRFHSAVWTGSEMIVWGGYQADGFEANDGGRYDPATDTWTPLNLTGAPSARYRHTAVWTGTRMLVWGGSFFLGPVGDGGSYNPASNSWSAITTAGAAPQARSSHAAVWTGSRMLIWGGLVQDGFGSIPTASGASYNPVNNSWSQIGSSGAPTARADHAYAWSGSQLLVWGGWDGAATLGDGARFDPQTNSWTPMSNSGAPSARAAASANWTGSQLIVFGGGSGSALGGGGRYDPASNSWTALPAANAPSPRLRHSAVWAGDQLIVWGGFNLSATLADGARYSPASNSWTPIAAGGSPSQRQHHSAVWTGSEMIVWGGSRDNGSSGSGNLDSGGRFSLSGGWRPTRVSSLQPSVRDGHSAVWTGNEMIIWGGQREGFVWATDGGRYEPATGDWRPTRSTGAPTRRRLHSAVWTGSQMLIWDGASGGGSGAAYSPQADTWTALPGTPLIPAFEGEQSAIWSGTEMIVVGWRFDSPFTLAARYRPATQTWVAVTDAGAPGRRFRATAVWLGDSLLIWGGTENLFTAMQSGAIYRPASNSWTPISLDGAPSPRFKHVGVAADGRMYIWGGDVFVGQGFMETRTGAFYTPANNTWTAIDSVQAPEARIEAAGVWTGTELLIWAGNSGASDLASGGRYERAVNQWLPTPLAGAPVARRFHTAVWTGELMLVFGGRNSATWLNNLGVYAPYLDLPDALFADGFEAG